MKKTIKEAIKFNVESSLEDDDSIPEVFKGEYEQVYKLSIGYPDWEMSY